MSVLEGLLAQDVALGLELELPGAVDQVEERGAAVAAPGGHAPGDPVGRVGLLAGLERVVRGVYSATGVTPSNSCGNGSMPCSRRRSSFARRSSTAGLTRGSPSRGLGASILVILSFRAGPRGPAR